MEQGAAYEKVKKAFVQLAFRHHPDTSNNKNSNQKDSDKDDPGNSFVRIRRAFESIENVNGQAVHATEENTTAWTDETLTTWFHQETGQHLSFKMDASTRLQVANVSRTMSPGGLDRGGMWELAASVARQQEEGEATAPRPITTKKETIIAKQA